MVEAALAAAALLALGGLAAATRAPAILAVATGLATAAMVAVGRTASLAEVATAPARDRALEALIDALEFAESDHEIGATVRAQLGRAGPLADVRIWLGDDALRPAGDRTGPELAVPAEVRAFLLRLDRPIPIGDLATERLGRLRPPLLAWAGAIGADVLVPLCERDQLIGLVVGNLTGGRALRDLERRQLAEGARAIARAHTVTSLRRGIEARASLSREVELADVVRQARTSGGRRMVAGVEVAIAYHPAAHVAGDLWFTGELADGRAFVLIGDVTGRGTPAALVSAAVIGACQSATGLADATATPASVLTHLHQVVRAIDGGRHRVTATALMIERAQGDAPGRVSLAIAGHRGGYLARASGAGDAIELVPLVGRGAPLGEPEWRTSELAHDLAPGDTIVVVSDGVTAARNRAGAAWGERRLQRTLRGASGGVALAEVTLAALDDHVGDNRLDDDVLVVAVAP
ncbi:MAG: SpoIIE family protein phosphatase [Myxococcales bacterium]|nr:SpoIIE family protein phosphatase [Myxococcales bacterium]